MSKCKCKLRRWQNESLHVAIGPNANVLSDEKSTHTQSRCKVAHSTWRKTPHWSTNRICHSYSSFAFRLCTSGILSLQGIWWLLNDKCCMWVSSHVNIGLGNGTIDLDLTLYIPFRYWRACQAFIAAYMKYGVNLVEPATTEAYNTYRSIVIISAIKIRFHLCIIWIRMTNTNDECDCMMHNTKHD